MRAILSASQLACGHACSLHGHASSKMPWAKKTCVRFWCPIGEICGKNNSYMGDADTVEDAEARLRQHIETQPDHVSADMSATDIDEAIKAMPIENHEKDYWICSPTAKRKGKGKGAGKDWQKKRSRTRSGSRKKKRSSRTRSTSRSRRDRDHGSGSRGNRDIKELSSTVKTLAENVVTAVQTIGGGRDGGGARFAIGDRGGTRFTIGGGASSSALGADIRIPRQQIDDMFELLQQAENSCLDCSKLTSQASIAFSSQAASINRVRQELTKNIRRG